MRLRCFLLISLFAIILLVTVACQKVNVARLGQEFSLPIGDSVLIEGEELQIKFLEVVGDSRCPRGVTCVWEGEVSCRVEVTYQDTLQSVILTEPGLTSWPPEELFKEYKITYHVEPYPAVGIEITEDEYRLHLTLTKR